MPWSLCRLIKRIAEFQPQDLIRYIPPNTRGIYALLNQEERKHYDVVYVGLSAGERAGMQSRMKAHKQSKKLKWTHFTILEVHDNISRQEIKEMEGLLRLIYCKDSRANRLNKQLRYKPFKKITSRSLSAWTKS
jgi:hypothetical protein